LAISPIMHVKKSLRRTVATSARVAVPFGSKRLLKKWFLWYRK